MASSASISGLASGLDSASIIDQLMKLEAAPQTRLKARVASEQSLVTTLQGLNTRAALLGSRAADLAKPATWSSVSASSSSTAVTATATSGASPTRLKVTVTSLALTHQLGFAAPAALTDRVTGASTQVRLDRYDGTQVSVETGDGTLSSLVAALNDPANQTGVRASAVKSGDGYRLLVESTTTGAAQDFDLTAADGSALLGGATVRAGSDAALDLGTGITATSTTGTFTDLLPGLTLALGRDAVVGSTATVEVTRDASRLAGLVSDLVSTLNAVLSEVDAQTAYDASSGKAGPLAGDATVRSLRTQLVSTVFSSDGASLATVGVQVDRTGKVTFDQAAFGRAYAADPAGVAAAFTADPTQPGFAARLEKVAKAASDATTGSLTTAITGRRTGIGRLQDGIEAWDLRLEQRRSSLERQFASLETAMNQMSSQSGWLAGQLASLPTNS